MDRNELRRVKRHLMSWGTGEHRQVAVPADGVATIALADSALLPDLRATGLVGASTVVLAPGHLDDPEFVGFDGSLGEPGTELSLGNEFFLQTQDYASTAYLSVLGPTLVRISDSEDLALFLADARRAAEGGGFRDFLTAPAVRLADVPALGAGGGADGPRLRLHVDADGALSTSPAGRPLGHLGDSLADLKNAWRTINRASSAPCAVCLAGRVSEEERAGAVAGHPGLPRYLAVLDVLRILTVNEIGDLRVSGFGTRLDDVATRDDDADLADPTLPVLAWNDEGAYVVAAGKVFGVDHAAACAVERVLALGSVEAADRVLPDGRAAHVAGFFARHGVRLAAGHAEVAAG